jgi:competence protein ComEC
MARVSEYPEYIAGDILDIEGKLTIPPSFEDFDYAQFLASQEIYLQLEASETAYIGRETGFVGAMSNVRNSIRGLVSQSIPEPQSALLQGLLLGGRVELGEELEQNLRNSGTSHIVAVSGYNVTSVIIILMLIAGTVPRRVLSLGCLIALVCFLYLVGPENLPARRAVYMGLLLIGSLLAGRKSMLPLGLIYVSTLMLLENPLVWRNISFQLSVAAMVGILVFSSSIRELFKWLPSAVSEILASTLAVMLTTIPISVSTFGSISMVALPANLVILPTIPIIMLAGALGVFMMLVAPWLGSFLFWMANLGLWLVISLIEWFGSLPNAATEDTSIALTWIVSVAALYFISDYLSYEKSLE